MKRRVFLAGVAASIAAPQFSANGQTADSASTSTETFDGLDSVSALAADLARREHKIRRRDATGLFADLGYDAYRAVRYRPDRRLWAGERRGFTVDLLPPGWLFHDPVDVAVVEDGATHALPFDASAFDYDPTYFPEVDQERTGEGNFWSGMRIRFPLNRPEVDDEVAVFQGASYFRAIGRGQIYGLSARALAIGTASSAGEEFPIFRKFWLERPPEGATEMKLWALLDSPSLAGAYEFLIRPGAETTMDIRSRLFPRQEIAEIGVAPLTSMYYFGLADRRGVDDHRDAAHDSSGLQLLTGRDERVWRPLTNPGTLQFSSFVDENPHGFGLAQRSRGFPDFSDAEARYELRPSAWVQPKGDWGRGVVALVEIPTDNDTNDNIVTFWRPREPVREPSDFAYRLVWSERPPDVADLARVVATRDGLGVNDRSTRVLTVDFAFDGPAPDELTPNVEAQGALLRHVGMSPLPGEGKLRVALDFSPPETGSAEFRLVLAKPDGAHASETWIFRWSPA
jgi:glucans biosynthesis protein